MNENLIEVISVTKSFRSLKALHKVSFSVPRSSIFGVLGPNGSGKTTLLRILLGLITPDEGKVKFQREPCRVSYLPEERGLYQDLEVLRVITYFGELKGLNRCTARKLGKEWLDRFDLSLWGHRKIQELSKGSQQKIQLIISLINDPDFLVLDEPFSGLDPLGVREVIDVLLGLKRRGKTVLLSTHQMAHAEALCDTLLLLDRGEVLLSGSRASILQQVGGGYTVTVSDTGPESLIAFPGVSGISRNDQKITLYLGENASLLDFLNLVYQKGISLTAVSIAPTSLDTLFVKAITERRGWQN